jgi:type IV secretion system protein VirB10
MNAPLQALSSLLRSLFARKPSAADTSQTPEPAVPGRSTAAELRWRATAPPIPRSVGWIVGAGVALLIAYYAHGTQPKQTAAAPTPVATADSVLPPLQKPADAGPAYSILSPDYQPTSASTTSAATPYPTASVGDAYGTNADPIGYAPRPVHRALTGAVFSRPAGATPTPTASPQPSTTWPITFPPGLFSGGTDPTTAGATAASANGNSMTTLLKPEATPSARASQLADRRLLLPKGSFIDCTLETAIDSSLPGFATCLTPVDTLSADGTVVLLERGTTLIGELRTQVQAGMARVYVLWSEARTPTGVVVPLASPGTDALGRTGIPGTVDRHFWDRFGAALLVSTIDGTIQTIANRNTRGGNTVVLNPNGAGDIATEVLRSTVAIPPTVRVNQGTPVQVLVARDIDFRDVYALRVR